MKTTEKQNSRITELTKKYGIDEKASHVEDDIDGDYFYFKSAFGNGYACIQQDGEVTGGNLGYYEAL